MRIPGQKRSLYPDECGSRAGMFAEAICDDEMDLAWSLLSKETRGMRMGVWATRNDTNMQLAYRAAYDPDHSSRASMLDDFRTTVLRMWPLEDLSDLRVAPTSYIDDEHAFAFLPFGPAEGAGPVSEARLMPGLIIPMLLEDGEWRVDMPGWRFLEVNEQG